MSIYGVRNLEGIFGDYFGGVFDSRGTNLVEIASFRTNNQSPVLLRIYYRLLQEARIDMAADSSSSSSSSVASPRRALSISREKASVFILAEGEGDRNKQGAKPAEVYGFVGSISTIVATGSSLSLYIYICVCMCV